MENSEVFLGFVMRHSDGYPYHVYIVTPGEPISWLYCYKMKSSTFLSMCSVNLQYG